MRVFALDTTTRGGSLALLEDGEIVAERNGDAHLRHAERLPAAIVSLLTSRTLALGDIDVYAVAAGPGSFTGLRVGIATIQGLALANGRDVVPVSALDALALAGAYACRSRRPTLAGCSVASRSLVGAWMDASRHEVFSALYDIDGNQEVTDLATIDRMLGVIDGPAVGPPMATLARWARDRATEQRPICFIGDGAVLYRPVISNWAATRQATVEQSVPPLAGYIALIAAGRVAGGGACAPDDIRPLYVRRPDAELARDRATRST